MELIGSRVPEVAEIQKNIDRLQAEVKAHPFFASVPPKVAAELARGERPYDLSHAELNARLAIDHDYYR